MEGNTMKETNVFAQLQADADETVWVIAEVMAQLQEFRNPLAVDHGTVVDGNGSTVHDHSSSYQLHTMSPTMTTKNNSNNDVETTISKPNSSNDNSTNDPNFVSQASVSYHLSQQKNKQKNSNYHQQIRRCFQQLDRSIGILNEAVDRYLSTPLVVTTNNATDPHPHQQQQQQQQHASPHINPFTPEIAASVRNALMTILLGASDLMELHVSQDDYRLHLLCYQVTSNAAQFLVQWCLQFQDLQANEATILLERVVDFVDARRHDLWQGSTFEELANVGILLSLVNKAYANKACNTFEDIFDGTEGTKQLLEVLYLMLPIAIESFQYCSDNATVNLSVHSERTGNRTTTQEQEQVYEELWAMINSLLIYVSQRIASASNFGLAEWLRQQTIQHNGTAAGYSPETQNVRQADNKANLMLPLMQEYASNFLDFTLDMLDSMANGNISTGGAGASCMENASVGGRSKATQQSSTCQSFRQSLAPNQSDPSELLVQAIRCTEFTCTVLGLVMGERNTSISTNHFHAKMSARSLWIAFVKLVLAVDLASMSNDNGAWAVDVMIHIALLTLDDGRTAATEAAGNDVAVRTINGDLDHGLKHALSITFLSSLDFPDVLVSNENALTMIERFSKGNHELRHLVQGTVLRQLVMQTTGSVRDPDAMEQVLQRLAKIGLQQTDNDENASRADPWNQFFRDEFAKLTCGRNGTAESSSIAR